MGREVNLVTPFILGLKTTIRESPFLSTEVVHERVGHNTGNLAFHYAIDAQLGGDLTCVDWSASVEQIDRSGDVAVVPCANQVGAHADYAGLGEKFARLKLPIVAIGLGAQGGIDGSIPKVPEGTVNWVKSIENSAPDSKHNIAVRGAYSLKVLKEYGIGDKAVVLGCPTLFMNPQKELGKMIAERVCEPENIVVASGHQRWAHLRHIESSLTKIISESNSGSYVGQSPLEMIQLTRGEGSLMDEEDFLACRDYAQPNMSPSDFLNWSRKFGNVFFDIPAWIEHYRHFDFVVGTRIHGVMLALQAGVPGLCIVHDSRTLELCQTMLVPYVMAKDISKGVAKDDLLKLFKFDAVAFDENRQRLAKIYVDFLAENKLKPASYLQALAS